MKTTTASDDPKTFDRLQELVRDIDIAMVTTVTPDGALHSRPMVTRNFDDEGRLWFFAADDSGMAHDLEAEQAVNASYAEPKKRHYVSISGSAIIVHDRHRAEALWDHSLKTYFPSGLDDPHLALICVRVTSAEFWDSPSSKVRRLFGGAKDSADADSQRGPHVKVQVRAARESG